MRSQPLDTREVKPPVGQHRKQHGVLAGRSRHGDAEVGRTLGQVKDLGAVDEHRRCGLPKVEPAPVDLGDVSDQLGLDATAAADVLPETAQELIIGQVLKLTDGIHAFNIRSHFREAWRAP